MRKRINIDPALHEALEHAARARQVSLTDHCETILKRSLQMPVLESDFLKMYEQIMENSRQSERALQIIADHIVDATRATSGEGNR